MSFYSFYFLPVYSILISCTTFFALAWGIRRQKREKLKKIVALFVVKTEQTEKEIEMQIDLRLNDIIAAFKMQIPLVSMFLSKTKETELKQTAKSELMKLVPALKQQFLQTFTPHFQDQGMSFEEALSLRGDQLADSLWKEVKYPLFRIAASVGLTFGLFGAVFDYLIYLTQNAWHLG